MAARRFVAWSLGALVFAPVTARPQSAGPPDPDAERERQLVLAIRRSLHEIDALLLQPGGAASADAADAALARNAQRIDELLAESVAKSRGVIERIDQLIDLTKD